jgi:hypothetical protein
MVFLVETIDKMTECRASPLTLPSGPKHVSARQAVHCNGDKHVVAGCLLEAFWKKPG